MKQLEIYTTLILSTCHMTPEDNVRLEYLDESNSPILFYNTDGGYRIYFSSDDDFFEETIEECKKLQLSESFIFIMNEARTIGCKWVEFDRDGEQYPERFKKYKW